MLVFTGLAAGCWNYREVEQLAIVSGVAIDKDVKDKIVLTVEIVNVQQEQKQSSLKPVYIQASGDSFFDAVRGMVALQGKRLYWSHAKVILLGEELAKDEISTVLDFISRDAEVREDMWILLVKGEKASDIFNAKPELDSILSFQIDNTLRAQRSISRYPSTELYEFLDSLGSKETSTVIPVIKTVVDKGKKTTKVGGAAVISRNKLLGYLDESDVKNLLWIQNEFKGGIFVVQDVADTYINVTLEIFKSKTKIEPMLIEGKPAVKLSLMLDVSIGEIMGSKDFISEKGIKLLEAEAEKQVKEQLEGFIDKAQKQYKTDMLGFGKKLKQTMPKVWKEIEGQWEEIFIDLETTVDVNVQIKGSATTRKPIKVGI